MYGANQSKEPDKKFKSEEELIDETRKNIEKHLKGLEYPSAAVKEEKPGTLKNKGQSLDAADQQTKALLGTVPVFSNPPEAEEETPAIESETVSTPGVEIGSPAEEENPVETGISNPGSENGSGGETAQFVEEKGDLPSDVTPVAAGDVNKPIAAEVVFSAKRKGIYIEPALEEPVLKKMDISKIGAAPYYETYEGLRLLKYFTVAQRVEIYQEPRPIDSYIMDAHAMRYLYNNTPWNIDSDYRTHITPIFTRAYGTEFTISDPKNKEGQIRYTHDYRDIYKNYWPKYPNLKSESWDQNEVLLMHSKNIEPINWLYTSNLGYRFSTMNFKGDAPNYPSYEIRSTYFCSFSLAPTDKIEYFMQGEYFKSSHVRSAWAYNPDHFLGRGEVRIKSNDYKTMYVPQLSYSKDLYYPGPNSFEKYEIAFRVGRDWSRRFSSTHTVQYVYSFRDEPDNQAPLYAAGYYNPIKDKAEGISLENRLSYNVYDRLYLQAGLDINNGINWSVFDNIGFLGGIEYYAPGMIRVDVGWRGNYYYDLADFLSCIYFKFYLFM